MTSDAGMTMGEESIIAKITIKDIGCDPKKVNGLPENERSLPLCRIYGKATDVKYQEDTRKAGEVYTYFTGTFEAINMQTGEVFRSGKLFLPGSLTSIMETNVKAALDADKSNTIAFGFEIQAVKAGNPIGYSYQAVQLRKPEEEDQLGELRRAIRALPASKGTSPKTLDGQTVENKTPARKTA